MRSTIIGCDPGFSGAFCFITTSGIDKFHTSSITTVPMPVLQTPKVMLDETAIKNLIATPERGQIDHFFIERALTMPGQGISSAGRFMEQFGFLRGLCVGLGIPYTIIHPVRWKKILMDGMPKEKEASLVRVAQLYPKLELKGNKQSRIGQADAVLIAHYGQKYIL